MWWPVCANVGCGFWYTGSCGNLHMYLHTHIYTCIWVRSRNYGCLVTWFCYQLIAKPGNKTVAVSWPDPYTYIPTPGDDIHICQWETHIDKNEKTSALYALSKQRMYLILYYDALNLQQNETGSCPMPQYVCQITNWALMHQNQTPY